MARTLIAYSTVEGHTLTICNRLKEVLETVGHTVELFEIGRDTDLDLTPFELVVVGASIRYGRHRPDVYRFIEANREALDQKVSAFFSVNVVARKPGKDTPESNPYVRSFRQKTTWAPRELAVFAGRLDYPRYGLMDRLVIRLIMWLTNGPTDPTASVEFTDWRAVEGFAHRVSNLVAPLHGAGRGFPNANAASEA